MGNNYPDEGRGASDGEGFGAGLPFRAGGPDHPSYTEARAEVRDRETYYTELRFAICGQTGPTPAPRAALDDLASDAERWDEIVAHFGDTWT